MSTQRYPLGSWCATESCTTGRKWPDGPKESPPVARRGARGRDEPAPPLRPCRGTRDRRGTANVVTVDLRRGSSCPRVPHPAHPMAAYVSRGLRHDVDRGSHTEVGPTYQCAPRR